MTMLIGLLVAQAAVAVPPPPPSPARAGLARPVTGSALSDLDGLSAEGRAIVDRAMAEWRPLAAEARAAAARADAEVAAATRADPFSIEGLAAALRSRDEGEAAWRRRRTELGVAMVEALPPIDRAIAARLVAGVVGQGAAAPDR